MTSCSLEALAIGEPLPGTAPPASAWIVIEQPGPWGRSALVDSLLDPRVAEHLAAASNHGVSVLLARHSDRAGRDPYGERHVWVARTVAGGQLMRHGVVGNVDELLKWDIAAIGSGRLPALGTIDTTPMTFICTHSKRDMCCAVEGRALVGSVHGRSDEARRARIWECSHIGGHRFAPVVLSLPSGAVHGRVSVAEAIAVIDAAASHQVVLDRLRGQSGFPEPHQVAAIEVMRTEGIDRDDALDVLRVVAERVTPVPVGQSFAADSATVEAEVRHVDGRAWRAVLMRVPLSETRRESCAKQSVDGFAWECASLVSTTPWL